MQKAPQWIFWSLPIIAGALFLGIQLAYQPVAVAMLTAPVFVMLILLYRFRSPIGLILVLCSLYAGTLGILDSVPTMIPGVQTHDAVTLGTLAVMLILLLLTGKEFNVALIRPDKLYILFVLWAVTRAFSTPRMFDAAKDIIFFSVFWTTMSLTRMYVNGQTERAAQVRRWLLAGAVICYLIHLLFIALGFASWSAAGLTTPIGKRPLALYLMIILAVSLAQWRYPGSRKDRKLGLICTALSTILVLATLSRTVIVTIAVVHFPLIILARRHARFVTPRQLIKLAAYAGALGVAVALLLSLDLVQTRFFYRINPHGYEGLLSWRNLNTMGRANVWPVVWRHALQHPFVGHGTGSVREFVTALCGWAHPHCDYLRIFHDQGLVGLTLFVGAWVHMLRRLLRARRTAIRTQTDARPSICALVALISVLVSFITDNTIVYTYATLPLAMLLGAAEADEAGAPPDPTDSGARISPPPVELPRRAMPIQDLHV